MRVHSLEERPLDSFSFHDVIAALTAGANAGTLNTGLLVTVFFLVLGGAIAKSAQFPLFTWLYSAMEAPTSISALFMQPPWLKQVSIFLQDSSS